MSYRRGGECQRGPLRENKITCATIPDDASVDGWVKLTDQPGQVLEAPHLEIFVDQDDQIAFPLAEEF